MKRLYALVLSLVLALGVCAGSIKPPKGFNKQVYDATYALYATSDESKITRPRFLCTVTAFQKYQEGYLLIGAGHCTTANPALPADMQFFVEPDISQFPQSVELIKAAFKGDIADDTVGTQATGKQPLDFAIFYWKTKTKIKTIPLGTETSIRIGSKVTNVNFSEGLAKMLSPGFVSSDVALSGEMIGYFGVQMNATHGASGSSIIDSKTHKIVGMLIAESGTNEVMPLWIEPISYVETALQGADFSKLILNPEIPNVERPNEEFEIQLLSGLHGLHSGSGGAGRSHGSGSGRSTEHPSRPVKHRHEGGRPIDHEVFSRHFGREHCFRPEIYYNGGFYSFEYAGFWFDYEDQWPYPVEDVFIDLDADGYYYMTSPVHPGVRVQVWIP